MLQRACRAPTSASRPAKRIRSFLVSRVARARATQRRCREDSREGREHDHSQKSTCASLASICLSTYMGKFCVCRKIEKHRNQQICCICSSSHGHGHRLTHVLCVTEGAKLHHHTSTSCSWHGKHINKHGKRKLWKNSTSQNSSP